MRELYSLDLLFGHVWLSSIMHVTLSLIFLDVQHKII